MKKRNSSTKRFLSTTGHARRYQRSLFFISVFSVCLLGCSGVSNEAVNPMMPIPPAFTFDAYDVATGVAKHQTVLTGFLLGNPIAELVVVNVDEDSDRHLCIYTFDDDTWIPKLNVPLRPEVLFVDVAHIGGRDRLLACERDRLNWFDPESATEHQLVAVTANYTAMEETPHVDITHDLNGDGLDELVIPDVDGFWVFVQRHDGTFANPIKIGRAIETHRLYNAEGYRYTPWAQSGIHTVDYNRDGRSDLVFWNGEHFAVHYQNEQGVFVPEAKTFTIDVAFDYDTLASLVAPYGVRRRRKDHHPTGNMTGRVLHAFTDLNGDGVADIGIFSLKGESLWHMHSSYEVHFGTPTPTGGTIFASEVSTAIASDGIPFALMQHDFNGDTQLDMAFITIKPRIFKAIGMLIGSLLTRSVSMDLEFYCMKGGAYPDKPTERRKVKSHTPNASAGRTAFPPVLLGNVNGDGRVDLLVGRSGKNLNVFIGVPEASIFARKSQKVAVTMPTYEEYTWLVELNTDKKQDILMHHTSTTKPHRVTLLVAR